MKGTKVWYCCILFLSILFIIPMAASAALIPSMTIDANYTELNRQILTQDTYFGDTVDDAETMGLSDFEIVFGVSFYVNPGYPTEYEGAVVCPIENGATVRMEFEDFLSHISTQGYTVNDPDHFAIDAGIRPTAGAPYGMFGAFSMNSSIHSATWPDFDGTQIMGGYLIDYIEWRITSDPVLTVTEFGDTMLGNYYRYVLEFDYVAEFHGDPVPIPGAVWLFGSGLIGLVGIRKKFRQS